MKKILMGFVSLMLLVQGAFLQADTAIDNKTKKVFSKKAVSKGWNKIDDAFTGKYYTIYNTTNHTLHVMKGKLLSDNDSNANLYYDFTQSYCTIKPGGSRKFAGTGKKPSVVYAFRVAGTDYIVGCDSSKNFFKENDYSVLSCENLKRVAIPCDSNYCIDMSKANRTNIAVLKGNKYFYYRYSYTPKIN